MEWPKADSQGCKEKNEESGYSYWVIGGAIVGGTAAPFVVGALGFTTGGIAAGSVGASMMSAMGPVASGGVVATLQSVGVVGLSAGAKVGIGAAGAAAGAAVGAAATHDN